MNYLCTKYHRTFVQRVMEIFRFFPEIPPEMSSRIPPKVSSGVFPEFSAKVFSRIPFGFPSDSHLTI